MSLGTAQQVTQAVAQAIRTRDGPRLAAALANVSERSETADHRRGQPRGLARD
tara:strand:+ start:508 stop:666 length:159 start_codon:yes stop_codon:yes gene_type:complete